MIDSILNIIQVLSGSPPLQAVLAALGTLVLEDPTTVGCGLLIAAGKMQFITAYIGVAVGISVGDLGLYAIGRFLNPLVLSRSIIRKSHLEYARRKFHRNMILAVLGSRFLPGLRVPTYLAAGISRAPFLRFLLIAITASLTWTLLLISLTVHFGQSILPVLGRYKFPVAFVFLFLLAMIQWLAIRRKKTLLTKETTPYSFFEFWPAWLVYLPVVLQYTFLSIRYRSISLPTAANPGVKGGAFIGESKSEILDLVPKSMKKWVAPHITIKHRGQIPIQETVYGAMNCLNAANIQLPVVAKPDIGQRGFGICPIRREEELAEYVCSFPEGGTIILQKMIEYEKEAGVFYIRLPFEKMGRIFSINFKIFPKLIGDGKHTLRELIMANPRAKRLRHIFLKRHHKCLNDIVPPGEAFQLVFTGNHAQGCIFKDGTERQTPELLSRIHDIATALPEFYFGRFDIRFRSEEEFLNGQGFQIVEINGAGSEATNIWDPEMDLITAYGTLFKQWSLLFKIGDINRKRGFAPVGLRRLIQDVRRYRALRKHYPYGR